MSASTALQRGVQAVLIGMHLVHQADAQRLRRIELAAGHRQALGLGVAQALDQEGCDLRGHHAQRGFGQAEARRLGGEATSATQARPKPPPITVPSSTATTASGVSA
jgi:hypothetical protein